MSAEKYWAYLNETYSAVDFDDPQFPGRCVLKFVVPGRSRVCASLALTLDSAMSTPNVSSRPPEAP